MAKITTKTLKEGMKQFKLESDSNKKNELEKMLDDYLSKKELGYECPNCGKDIPDVDACPYCGESFTDEESEENEETEYDENSELEDEGNEEAGEEESEEESDEEKTEEEETEEKDEEKEIEKIADEVAKNVAKDKGKGKSKDKEKDKEKDKDKDKEKSKETSKEEIVEKVNKEDFDKFVEKANEALGKDFEKFEVRERKTGLTYVKDKKRLMKIVSSTRAIVIEFNVELPVEDENLTKFTEDEAKKKHLGSVRGMFIVKDENKAVKLIKQAVKLF